MLNVVKLKFLLVFIIVVTMISISLVKHNFNGKKHKATRNHNVHLNDKRSNTSAIKESTTSEPRTSTEKTTTTHTTTKPPFKFVAHQQKDMNRLSDQRDFRFLINSNICGDEPVFALLLVGSHPDHRDMRDVIRLTWGNPRLPDFPFKLVFPFGSLTDQKSQLKIAIESVLNGDIIQGNFLDKYHNMTLRDLMSMRWAWLHCPQARFVVHIDDDMIIDAYSLIDILQETFPNQSVEDPYMACAYIFKTGEVLREGKYKVSREDHPSDVYDQYCSGWLYVFNPAMARLLDDTSLMVKRYWMNDAFITGTLMKASNQTHLNMDIRWTTQVKHIREMANTWMGNSGIPPLYQFGPQDIDLILTINLHNQFFEYAVVRSNKPLPAGPSTKTVT